MDYQEIKSIQIQSYLLQNPNKNIFLRGLSVDDDDELLFSFAETYGYDEIVIMSNVQHREKYIKYSDVFCYDYKELFYTIIKTPKSKFNFSEKITNFFHTHIDDFTNKKILWIFGNCETLCNQGNASLFKFFLSFSKTIQSISKKHHIILETTDSFMDDITLMKLKKFVNISECIFNYPFDKCDKLIGHRTSEINMKFCVPRPKNYLNSFLSATIDKYIYMILQNPKDIDEASFETLEALEYAKLDDFYALHRKNIHDDKNKKHMHKIVFICESNKNEFIKRFINALRDDVEITTYNEEIASPTTRTLTKASVVIASPLPRGDFYLFEFLKKQQNTAEFSEINFILMNKNEIRWMKSLSSSLYKSSQQKNTFYNYILPLIPSSSPENNYFSSLSFLDKEDICFFQEQQKIVQNLLVFQKKDIPYELFLQIAQYSFKSSSK